MSTWYLHYKYQQQSLMSEKQINAIHSIFSGFGSNQNIPIFKE